MKTQKIKEYKSAVSYFKINKNGLVVVDEENRIYVYDNEFKLKNGFKIKLPKNKVNENTIDVSDDFKYLLLSVQNYPLKPSWIPDRRSGKKPHQVIQIQ